MKNLILVLALLIVSASIIGQETVATPSAVNLVDDLTSKIPLTGAIVSILGLVLEVALRLVKTEKPLSLLIYLGKFLEALSKLFHKLSELINAIIPQRTK